MTDNVIKLERVHVHVGFDKDGNSISRVEMQPVDEAWEALCDAHDEEAERQRAKFGNYGWVTDEHCITSKTSRGILTSAIGPNGQVIHEWA
jgi:hypothetical protein